MDYVALKTYIQTDPDNLGLAPLIVSGSDNEIANRINVKGTTKLGYIDNAIFASWAAKTGLRAKVEDIAVDATSPLRSSALALLDLLRGNINTGLNLAYQDNITMINTWMALEKITQSEKDQLIALGTSPASWGEVAGFGILSHEQVGRALREY